MEFDINLDIPHTLVEKTAIEQVAPKKQEYHLIGRQRRVAGHTLFEFNKITKDIRKAEIKSNAYTSFATGKVIVEQKVQVKPNCIYIQALNVINAKKKIKKLYLI